MIVNIMIIALININATSSAEGTEKKPNTMGNYPDQNEGKEMGTLGKKLFAAFKFLNRPNPRFDQAPQRVGYTYSATPVNLEAIKEEIRLMENTLTDLRANAKRAGIDTKNNFKNASGRTQITGKEKIIIKQRIAKENKGSNLTIEQLERDLGNLRMQRDNMEADLNNQKK